MEEHGYNLIKAYPQRQVLLLNKYVNVQLLQNTTFTGFIKSIDPISGSIVLMVPDENNHQMILVPGHAIQDVTETVPSNNIKLPDIKDVESLSNEDILLRKSKIMAWFKQNMLPVTDSNENIVLGNVTVLPPYSYKNICTDNAVVALQIRRIMENMPEDFKHTE